MYQARTGEVPIDEARNSSDPIQSKPEHQILCAIPTIHSNYLIGLYTQVLYQPIPHPRERIKELLV